MIFAIDIDGTLCDTDGADYVSARPFNERIACVNRLFNDGHTIKLFTARGSTTNVDWRSLTVEQLSRWGVQYHELIMGKPHYDVIIDDKAVSDIAFFGKRNGSAT